MYYSGIKWYDVNDGPGVRVGLYVSGCSNHCKGCFQPKTWNPKNGEEFDKKIQLKIFDQMKNDFITGITVLGGDPFYPSNVIPVTKFLKEVQERFPNKSIWAYTGYYYENLMKLEDSKNLISLLDVLVDGPFVLDKKDIRLKFKGSSNQRIIDIKKSTVDNVVLYKL